MTPPRNDPPGDGDEGWRYQALATVSKVAKDDHDRVRGDLKAETQERKDGDRDLREEFEEFKKEVKAEYVQKIEFGPVQRGFYALITVVMLAVVTAILTLVLRK